MAAELGIGVRVRLGWHANFPVDSLREGVIAEGPFPPNYTHVFDDGEYGHPNTTWVVELDSDDDRTLVVPEPYLFPIDDDNDQTTRDERELVEERV